MHLLYKYLCSIYVFLSAFYNRDDMNQNGIFTPFKRYRLQMYKMLYSTDKNAKEIV